MNKLKRSLICNGQVALLVLFLCIGMTVHGQSPWLREQGQGYAQLALNVIPEYEALFNAQGPTLTTSRLVQDKTLQFYGEYGILKNTSLILDVPFKWTAAGDTTEEPTRPSTINSGKLNGFGNIQVAVRQKLWEKKYILSAQLKAELPTASYDDSTGLRTGYDALAINPTLSVGRGWSSMYAYIYGGPRFTGNDYSNYLTFGGEVGFKVGEGFWFIVLANVFESLNDGDRADPEENRQTGLFVNNQEYFGLGFKLLGDIKKDVLGFTVSSSGAASGHLVARSPSLNLGFYLKW